MINTSIIVNNSYVAKIDKNRLSRVCECVFEHFNITNAELSLSIVSDDQIKSLNKKYCSMDSLTDVLSFSSQENNPETGMRYYGDIAISYPAALRQFPEYHDSVIEEIIMLTIHGILHLFGFDHQNPKEKDIMLSVQKTLFEKQLGINII